MSHIFISYSRRDLDFAQKIVDALADGKLDTWIDWKSIPKGEDWEQEIYRGIEEADAFLFLISPDSVASQMCNKEIDHAVKNGKRILPIVIRDSEPKIIHPEISKRNWIFCRDGQDDFNKAIEEIQETIHTDFGWVRFQTDLLIKAKRWEQRKDSSRLLRGKELREAEQQLAQINGQDDPQPTKLQREYVLASRRNEESQRMQIIVNLAFGLLVTAALAAFALVQRNSAIDAKNDAVNSQNTAIAEANTRATAQVEAFARQKAAQAQLFSTQFSYGPFISTLIGIESLKIMNSLEGEQAIYAALDVLPTPVKTLDHSSWVGQVSYSPNGNWMASGSGDGIVRVWNTSTGEEKWNNEISHVIISNSIRSLSFNSDGTLLAAGSYDGTLSVWEVETNKNISTMQHGHSVESVMFSSNGKSLVSGSKDGTVRVWDVMTGNEIMHMSHDDWVWSAKFHPDGLRLVSASHDGTVRLWELASGKELARIEYDSIIWNVDLSPDGNLLAFGCDDGMIQVWDVELWEKVVEFKHDGPVFKESLAFSPDGRWLAVGSNAGTIRVWEARTGVEIARMKHDDAVRTLKFSSSGRWIASGSDDGTLRVWETETGEEIARMIHDAQVWSVNFHPDESLVVSGSEDRTLRIWKSEAKAEVASMQHDGPVFHWASSPNGDLIASAGKFTLKIWEAGTGKELHSIQYDEIITALNFSPNGKWIAVGDFSGSLRVWEVEAWIEVPTNMKHPDNVEEIVFSPDSKWMISTGIQDRILRVWRVGLWKEMMQINHDGSIISLAFSSDGRWLAFGGSNNVIRVLNAEDWKEVARMYHYDYSTRVLRGVFDISFSPDNSWLVSGSSDTTLRLWDTKSWTEVKQFENHDGFAQVAFSADGRLLAAITYNTIEIWKVDNWLPIASLVHREVKTESQFDMESRISTIAFSPDSNWLASGGSDDTVRIWDAKTGKELVRMYHNDDVEQIRFSPDGRFIVSGSSDRTVRVWLWKPEDLIAEACRRLPRNLTQTEWNQYMGNTIPYHATCPNLPIPIE